MKCSECPDFENGKCSAIPDAPFQTSPDADCVLDKVEQEADAEFITELMHGRPEQKLENLFPYFSAALNSDGESEEESELLPGDEAAEDSGFFGTEQSEKKLAVCKHICDMANGIKRAAPYHIRLQRGDFEDNTHSGWALMLDLHAPTVFLSMPLRKRLCEMILAADQIVIGTADGGAYTRFTFVVSGLWR